MTRIKNWTAKRSGAAMTIQGVDAKTERPVLVTGVVYIEARPTGIVASRFAEGEPGYVLEPLADMPAEVSA